MGTVRHWQPFWASTRVRFIGQCWYFNPQWTATQAIINGSSVRTLLVSWNKKHIYKVSTHISVFVEVFRRCGGYVLAPEWKPYLQGSSSLASHSSELNRSEQNSSKLQHTVCDVFYKLFGVERLTTSLLLTLRLLMSYIYGVPILDVSRSHTTTHHSR